ncbi:hypothetical protein SAMN06309945_0196 [Okibacterium fritillariae]|uniref:Uncharacterized protein n=1 Tax=Okibacterium fritillariae TaxID=123320 RepID=A0A1T5IBC3_9MICO|nr:hypothetical protein SAMN06309945_0196 [Okibacterium fritillariae]
MIMTVVVGVQEQHTVVFSFDKVWGRLSITVDGQSVVDTVRVVSLSRVATWEFPVGWNERHIVRIEKHRAAFFAGFRPQPVYAYVNGVLVAQNSA